MPWYAAHVVMGVKFKTGTQIRFPVWENIHLVEGRDETEALQKAKLIGAAHEGDDDGSFYWDNIPSTWVFLGVRKLIAVAKIRSGGPEPGDGDEITWTTLEFDDKASLDMFMSCEVTSASILD